MNFPTRLLGAILLGGFLVAAGYRWGSASESDRRDAQQLQAERAANAKYLREVERGIDAAASAINERRELEERYADLDQQHAALRKRVPILVRAAARPSVVVAAPAAAADQPEPADPATEAPWCVPLPVAEHAGFELTAGAVWMWNSALAASSSDVPAGACGAPGAAGATDAACSAGSGLTVDDAWDNHTENAKRAARNAARLERLIRFLQSRNRSE